MAEQYYYKGDARERDNEENLWRTKTTPAATRLMLFISWIVVGVPLVWGVYNTLLKLPALFR